MLIYFIIAVILTVIIIGLLYRETKLFEITRDEVRLEKVKGKNIKIAFLSDLHNYSYGNDNDIIVEAIKSEKPDLIIISGDMIIAKPNRKNFDVALSLLKRLPSIAPVYYANGNHEYRMKIYEDTYENGYSYFKESLKNCGIQLLENEKHEINIHGNLCSIYGLEIEREYYKRGKKVLMKDEYLKEVLGTSNEKKLNLLIAHNPIYFPEYAKWGADITFSGHLHGGLIRIPGIGGIVSPQMELFPKYDAGIYDLNGRKLILSRGLGAHTIHIRIFNRAELKILNVKSKY
ncbi:metallophosphoesterase [Anaerosacchariphilus polymeriproducens]|uniref:Metallophosphoesterase n=1 Tax=Anaerosacchariphilus polymeriproducens TaxID=1812858 RepID=A0A371ATT3_9FIRM|nr:metallophosphoesterase [Anaerosacchariphilus polymeriproducens]RDU22975.1 metallophosphoesterase [Anaerosacchariphilus polymeriproducens]